MRRDQRPLPVPERENREVTVTARGVDSPSWSPTAKILVVIITLIIMALLAWRFQGLLMQIVVAAMLAYLLNPLISFIDRHTPFMRRSAVVIIIYFTFFLIFLGGSTAVGVAAYNQITALVEEAPRYINQGVALLQDWAQNPPQIGPITLDPAFFGLGSTFDLDTVREQLLNFIEPLVTQGGSFLARIAGSTVGILTVSFFVFVVSIYIANEIPSLSGYVGSMAQRPGYRRDAERLMKEFGRIWSSYLRGQVVLGLIIGTVVAVTLSALGVRNAVALGVLSGLMEFVPVIGAIIGGGAAVIVAFFQPSNYMGLEPWQFALVVALAMLIVQQLENNLLVPRIVGNALDLHPLFVMIAVFMGGSVAGILGAILAAPVLATAKLLGLYAWRKLFDEEPFPDPEPEPPPPIVPGFVRRFRDGVRTRFQTWRTRRRMREAESPDDGSALPSTPDEK